MTQTIQRPQPERQVYVDAMKGLGIILVVWGHFEERFRGVSPIFNGTFECMYMFHMALFCLCSGLVAKLNIKKWIGQQLWLYLICQVLMAVFRVVVLQEDLAAGEGGMLGAVLLPWMHMWYLYAMLFWELTVPVLDFLRKKLGIWGGVLGVAAALLIALFAGNIDWPLKLNRVFAFFPFYAVGVLFRREIAVWARATGKNGAIRLILGAVAAVWYGHWLLQILGRAEPVYENARIFHDVAYGDGYTMLSRGAFYLIGTLTALFLISALGNCKTLASLGKRTLPIYIFHMPVLWFLIQLGVHDMAATKGIPALAGWLVLVVGGVVCFFGSKPVCTVCTGIANLWYKILPSVIAKAQGNGRQEEKSPTIQN